jgi:hypothetical protein
LRRRRRRRRRTTRTRRRKKTANERYVRGFGIVVWVVVPEEG